MSLYLLHMLCTQRGPAQRVATLLHRYARGRNWQKDSFRERQPTFMLVFEPSQGSLHASGMALTDCTSSSHVAPSPQTSKIPCMAGD